MWVTPEVITVYFFRHFPPHKTTQYCLCPVWLSRKYNVEADGYSRILDYDDWGLTPDTFQTIRNRYGQPQVDRFVNTYNTKCPRFNSRFFSDKSEAVDTLSQHWGGSLEPFGTSHLFNSAHIGTPPTLQGSRHFSCALLDIGHILAAVVGPG